MWANLGNSTIQTNPRSENLLRTTGASHMASPRMNSAVMAVGRPMVGLVQLSASPRHWLGLP